MDIYLLQDLKNSIIESVVDGTGVRLVLFMSGCSHRCKGCLLSQSWELTAGKKYSVQQVADELARRFNQGSYNGITFSGGDPLYQKEALLQLIKLLKMRILDVNIWCYTGFYYEDIEHKDLLREIDVLVDGPFIQEQRALDIKFRGSKNQRIIYLNNGEIVTME